MPVQHPIQDLPGAPFGDPSPTFSPSELRETAYEILVGACRSSGPKPLTFISQSERGDRDRAAPSPSLHRSLTSTAASKVKKALGLKTSSSRGSSKRAATTGELVRVQMRISEQSDTRIRRALLRIAAGQLGRRMESVVLPLELIQLFRSSDFPSQQEYEACLRRNLKVLEAGLVSHPHLPLDKSDPSAQSLRRIIRGAFEKPLDIGKNGESMQTFRTVVMSLACRSSDGSISETCHWTDGFPLNLWIYQTLLEACFDLHAESSVIEEVDDVIELIKKTWAMLGINEMLHNICFSWVLFHRYVVTGQVDNDLLFASSNLLEEVGKDTRGSKDRIYSKILRNTLSLILSWAEKRLLAYHHTFHNSNIESMESVISLAVLSVEILEDIPHDKNWKNKEDDEGYTRVDKYIRSSLHAVFIQRLEKLDLSKHPSKKQNKAFPLLSVLAQDVTELAINEKAIFSPKLKRWHPLATGVAVATLHVCYGNELKKYVEGINELTPDAIEVLIAADKLEKDLVQIAVEDSVDSEDGGKSIIREMQPYEAESVIATLVKSWINIRVDRLGEWVDRNLQQEVWNPGANKEGFAPSAVEVLRIIDDTLEAFFLLPIPMHADLLPDLMSGLDKSLQQYILKAKSGCGSRSSFVPTLPALTRCSARSKFNGVFRKKEKSQMTQRRKAHVGTTNGDHSIDITQLCVRINTMQRIRMELGVLEKRILANLSSSRSTYEDIANGVSLKFKLSASAAVEGIRQLCECVAYKIVFHDLCHVLWDRLYVQEIASARIAPFLQELEQYLEIVSSTVHDRVRTRVIVEVMQASFEGFLLVLLAGGPSRAFTLQDSVIIEEDFKFLTGLFWSNGDGLPAELIEKHSSAVKGVLPLFHADTEHVIQQFSQLVVEMYGPTAKSRLPMPPTADEWGPKEPNTLLRVLCNRNDEAAAKFLKKNYNLPKKL